MIEITIRHYRRTNDDAHSISVSKMLDLSGLTVTGFERELDSIKWHVPEMVADLLSKFPNSKPMTLDEAEYHKKLYPVEMGELSPEVVASIKKERGVK